MYFRYFSISLLPPLGKGRGTSFKNFNFLQVIMLCAKFAGNWPSGSGEEDENVKNLQTDGRTTDDQKSSVNLQLR